MSGRSSDTATVDLERLRRYQEIFATFSRIASESKDVETLLHLACIQACRGVNIGHTKVLRYRPEKGDLLMAAGIGWKPGLVGHCTFGIDLASPPGRTLQTRQPVMIPDITATSEFRRSRVLQDHGIVSLLNAPIVADNSIWGVLEVDSERAGCFHDDDVLFLSAMANILGAAIHRFVMTETADEEARKALQALTDQRTLMRELQHRIKNNFMVITSALILEKQRQDSAEAKAALDEIMSRVFAISIAHDQLMLRDSEDAVGLGSYLSALASNISHQHEWVRIETDLDDTELPVDRATPLGPIANELMTNAVKHAFPDRSGTIRITLRADANRGEAWMIVEDDGIGMGPPRPGSLGTRLISALAQQIGGAITCETPDRGTRFRLRFPIIA